MMTWGAKINDDTGSGPNVHSERISGLRKSKQRSFFSLFIIPNLDSCRRCWALENSHFLFCESWTRIITKIITSSCGVGLGYMRQLKGRDVKLSFGDVRYVVGITMRCRVFGQLTTGFFFFPKRWTIPLLLLLSDCLVWRCTGSILKSNGYSFMW